MNCLFQVALHPPSYEDGYKEGGSQSGDTTPCIVAPVILHGSISPERLYTRDCSPRDKKTGTGRGGAQEDAADRVRGEDNDDSGCRMRMGRQWSQGGG